MAKKSKPRRAWANKKAIHKLGWPLAPNEICISYFECFPSRCITLLMPLTVFVVVDEIELFMWCKLSEFQ